MDVAIDPNKEKYYTTKQAAAEAGVSQQTIGNAIRAGKLVAMELSDNSVKGYHYRISETHLLEWIEDRKTVKANIIATSASEMNIEDIAAEITKRIKKAYDEGFSDGVKHARRELQDKIKNAIKD